MKTLVFLKRLLVPDAITSQPYFFMVSLANCFAIDNTILFKTEIAISFVGYQCMLSVILFL